MPFEQSIEIPPRIDFAMILHITETLLIVDWFDITSFLALQPLKDTYNTFINSEIITDHIRQIHYLPSARTANHSVLWRWAHQNALRN